MWKIRFLTCFPYVTLVYIFVDASNKPTTSKAARGVENTDASATHHKAVAVRDYNTTHKHTQGAYRSSRSRVAAIKTSGICACTQMYKGHYDTLARQAKRADITLTS